MSAIRQSIGIDISKDSFDACISQIDNELNIKILATRKFKQSSNGFEELVNWVEKRINENVAIIFIMEATGVYHEQLAWFLHHQGHALSIILPSKAKKYIQSTDYKTKTDKVDAKALAQLGLERKMREWKPLSKNIYLLRALTREIDELNEERTALKGRLHAKDHAYHDYPKISKRVASRLKLIEKQIIQVRSQIEKTVEKDPVLKEKIAKLTSIKGVGFHTATVVIAETNGFEGIEKQGQIASYAGLDIVKNDSGTKQSKGRISKKGNARLRKILFMPGFNVIRFEVPVFKNLYNRLINKGKSKMQVYVAIHRKLLTILWTLWKNDAFFDELHYKT